MLWVSGMEFPIWCIDAFITVECVWEGGRLSQG